MRDQSRILMGVVGVIAALAAIWVLALAPKRHEASDLATRIVVVQQARDAALTRAAGADRARAGYDHDYATVARLGKAVPVNADVPSLVFQLESAARRAKVDFRSVSVLDTTPQPAKAPGAAGTTGGGIQPAPFSFKFEGGYFGLQKLLAAVDRFSRVKGTQIAVNGRLLTIDGLTLSPALGGLPRIRGIITARAYVADLPNALPGAAAAPPPAPGDGQPTSISSTGGKP